ncbi:hypothetical protein Cgig2_022950 [Carnegiea gigantea]|uniref:Uncharacterized protein n=1 Tax=Carnegiea gigantea TaxID=171969 RepID=A0A9Q1KBN5_9CARY|nr:hypothetical protein Cgig2_022950 [Carnegiea gigantea]
MSDQNTHPIKSDFRPHHLQLMEEDTQESATIYQLRASMNKKLSPQSSQEESSSPEAAQELRNLLQRLVEIDVESRDLLRRVSSLLDKDDRLEHYMKERIEDPKVSRMWQLIEQVLLACQDEERSDFDELVVKNDSTANPSASAMDKAIKGNATEETKPYSPWVIPRDLGGAF